jgi:hypothetical protein
MLIAYPAATPAATRAASVVTLFGHCETFLRQRVRGRSFQVDIALRIRTTLMHLEHHDASLYLPEAGWELLPRHGRPSGVHFL